MAGKRIQLLTFSETIRFRDAISVLRERGLDVVELHGGEPCFETVDEIKFAMEQAIAENRTGYMI
jgi:aspartate aminotransferase